ncbi:MAG TPA: VacB/RNase II family 3'-5' exoribonuclease, partial [Candidatus Polarisedimenticolia bacterium]|nr:VacB/RNase II family 3'-5' exoribonuclease [Candidatus Polarisedimenticolia bacterium]
MRSHPLAPACDYTLLLDRLAHAKAPLTIPGLIEGLGLDRSLEPLLRRQMEFLEKQGVLVSHRRGRWTMRSRARIVVGRFSRPSKGFGFIRPGDGSTGDLYVGLRGMGGAAHGDRVMARIIGSDGRARGRVSSGKGGEAEIFAILERRSPFIAGIFQGDAHGGVLRPFDERVATEVLIGPSSPASLREPLDKGPTVAWAEITDPEERYTPARGRLIEVLGRPEDPGVDEAVIVRTYDLPGAFPPDAEKEARSHGGEVSARDLEGREDFTRQEVVTVDPATARDHDDAVAVEPLRTAHGMGFRLFVHIADVAHYVREGSAVDREAVARGTSVYLPGRCIPMLPEPLSSGLCSLVPERARLVQSVIMDFDAEGTPLASRFADGVIRSASSLTYEEVSRILRDEPGHDRAGMLRKAHELSRAIRSRRMQRGSLDLNLPETEVLLDAEGSPTATRVAEHTEAHEIIEEFMIAANETVARHLHARGEATLYRIHEEPDDTAVAQVEEDLIRMGFPVRRGRGSASARLGSLLAVFRNRPEESAVAMMILRCLKLARYSHEAIGHFGLASELYTHFTSPIRRYPDLVVHRSLRRSRQRTVAAAEPDAPERLESLALECSRLERRAEEAERALLDCKKAQFMKDKIGESFDGMVTGVTQRSLFVSLDGLGVEGIVQEAGAP